MRSGCLNDCVSASMQFTLYQPLKQPPDLDVVGQLPKALYKL